MKRHALATIILNAPAWSLIGLTVPDDDLRERAAETLAGLIVSGLTGGAAPDRDQLSLPFPQDIVVSV